jgi:hypothetical protein
MFACVCFVIVLCHMLLSGCFCVMRCMMLCRLLLVIGLGDEPMNDCII